MPDVPIYALDDLVPDIDPLAYVHPDAVIIGNVSIGAHSSIWPGAVLRGDTGRIVVGEATSVQDNAVLHCTGRYPTVVGSHVVIGHQAHLEGCTVEDGALIGVVSVSLWDVTVGAGATVGGGAVCTVGLKIPPGALAVGVPAKIKEGGSHPDAIWASAEEYVHEAARYTKGLRRLD